MESNTAIPALAALAQTTRLEAFRLLVGHEPDGMAAGDLAHRLAVPANTLSAHLTVLARAGLVNSERRGRSIIYRADITQVRVLLMFLLADCCGGQADRCAPMLAELLPCRP